MNEPSHEFAAQGIAEGIALVFRELYIEIFAVIVPGLCFFIAMVPAIVIPLKDIMRGSTTQGYSQKLILLFQTNTGVAFFCILVMSYVVGQILFRCDPKYPDIASIKARPRDQFEGSCVEEVGGGREEFPYAALKDFLIRRQFDHLAEYIHWTKADFDEVSMSDDSSKKARYRSKHLINQLKLSVKLHHPRIYFEISRNETHVRLMSSLWYLALVVMYASFIGLVFGVISNAVAFGKHQFTLIGVDGFPELSHGEAVLYPILAMISTSMVRTIIKKYFHYQRVREIVYVLEAWYLVDPARIAKDHQPPR